MRYEREIKDATITGFSLARVTDGSEQTVRRQQKAPREADERMSLRYTVYDDKEGKATGSQAGDTHEDSQTWYYRKRFQKMPVRID